MCHIPTDREKFWAFFGILLYKIPCGDSEMSPLYLCSPQPLLSILKLVLHLQIYCTEF